MVAREHLFLLMARCYEVRQHLAGLQFLDTDKNQLRDELIRYADAIYSLPPDRVNRESKDYHAKMAIVITSMMSFLIELHNNAINQELQYVVTKLALDWSIDPRTNIILFCHGDFAVRHYDPSVFYVLNRLYSFSFTKQPRIVYLPREYDGDILFSSVVFHEVGHMVENDRKLGGKVFDELFNIISMNNKSTILRHYFRLDFNQSSINEDRMKAYIKEYIADLFGSQYLGKHILHFLDCHEALHRDKDTSDHPCFECRKKLVESFMAASANSYKTTDKFLQIIINVFHNEPAIPDLISRDVNLSENAILLGNSQELSGSQELFSLFSSAWRASLKGIEGAEIARGMVRGTLTRYDYYSVINNATKQSIIDYKSANP